MSSHLNLSEAMEEVTQRVKTQEHTLGKGLTQPFNNVNSGSRKIMYGVHREHRLPLYDPEIALIQTGYENEFGYNSSSFTRAENNFVVVDKIPKFSQNPKHHYFLLVLNMDTNRLDLIERVGYKHITESYGYEYNNAMLDSLDISSEIKKGEVIKKSNSFDEYNNCVDGVNLRSAYIASDKSMEDGIILSKSAAEKLRSPLFKKVEIVINDNDILLNLYGSDSTYKTFPDVGENISGGIICAIRREKKEESLFTQSCNRLREIMMSDEKYTTIGKIVDINVYCNNPNNLTNSHYNSQLKYYYDEHMKFCTNFVKSVDEFLATNAIKMSYDLQKLYYTCREVLDGKLYSKDKVFSNTTIQMIVMENKPIEEGDKLSDRYGGKGVVSKVLDDELMPMIEDTGEYLEVLWNQSTMTNRVNPGQSFETSLNHISSRILQFLETGVLDFEEQVNLIYKFMDICNPEQAKYFLDTVTWMEPDHIVDYVASMCCDGGIVMSMRPVSNSMDIDKLTELYDEFPWAVQCKVKVPIQDSTGGYRYVTARRPIVCGMKYVYRLKQYAEEKFSVTSLSATNIKNENSRSKANKQYKGLFTKTPIRFGEMETGDMSHLGMEAVIVNLMIHSTSPQARRLAEELLTGDPFNINIKLDESSTNRSVEILNAYFKAMGLRLVFEKIWKNLPKSVLKKCPVINFGIIRPSAVFQVKPDQGFNFEEYERVRQGAFMGENGLPISVYRKAVQHIRRSSLWYPVTK